MPASRNASISSAAKPGTSGSTDAVSAPGRGGGRARNPDRTGDRSDRACGARERFLRLPRHVDHRALPPARGWSSASGRLGILSERTPARLAQPSDRGDATRPPLRASSTSALRVSPPGLRRAASPAAAPKAQHLAGRQPMPAAGADPDPAITGEAIGIRRRAAVMRAAGPRRRLAPARNGAPRRSRAA